MGSLAWQQGGPVGVERAQLVRRFDGTMGAAQDLAGRHRAHVQGVLSDWMAQVADATAAGPSLVAAQVTAGLPVGLAGQAQPTAGAAAAAATAAAGKRADVGMGHGTEEEEEELPSVDALLARLAKRFGLAPGTTPGAAGGGGSSAEGGSGTTGGSGGARMPSFWTQLAKASPSATHSAHHASGNTPGGSAPPPGASVLPTTAIAASATVALATSTSPPSKPAALPTQCSSVAAATVPSRQAADPQPSLPHAGVGPLSTTRGATSNDDIAIVIATPAHGSSTGDDSVDGDANGEPFLSSPTELIAPLSDPTDVQEPQTSAPSRPVQGDDTHAQAPVNLSHPHLQPTDAPEVEGLPDEFQDDEVAAQSSSSAEDLGAGAGEEGQWPTWLPALGVPRPVQVDQLPAAFRSNPPSAGSSSYDSLSDSYSSHAQAVSQPGGTLGGGALPVTEDEGAPQPNADNKVCQQAEAGDRAVKASTSAVALPDAYPPLEEEASGVSTPGGRAIPESEFTTPVGQKGPRLGRGQGLWGAGTPGTPGSGSAGRASSSNFGPVLGSLLDQAVGGMLFADTPSSGPPSARSTRSPMTHGSVGASPLRGASSSIAISPVDRRWAGEGATGSAHEDGGARTGAVGQGSGSRSRGGSPEGVGRQRQADGAHAAVDGREDAEGNAGAPPLVVDVASPTRLAGRGRGGLPGRLLRPETPEAAR